uniref:Ovule protein n=1 Tax=Mesocestoides corti TaxID=53468 RepID=A0A5K3G2H7_MESCO
MPPPTPIMSSSVLIGKTEGYAMATPEIGFHGSIASPLPLHQTHYQSNISDGDTISFGILFIPILHFHSLSRNATPTIAGCVNHMSLELCLFTPFPHLPHPIILILHFEPIFILRVLCGSDE